MRIVHWKLTTGNKVGQETAEQKRQAGLDYIERLKQEEEVIEVIEEANRFVIKLKD